MAEKLNRRDFLRLSALTAAGVAVAACAQQPTEGPEPTEVTEATPTQKVAEATPEPAGPSPNQAPMLQDKVGSGELAPLEERRPASPFVSEGLEGIGNYGGGWRLNSSGEADTFARGQVVNRGLLNINQNLDLHTYMAERYEVTPDATEWTFFLRKGLKWSDGEPMTSEDYRFWYEDIIRNEELTPSHPAWLGSAVEGEVVPADFSAPDEYTVRFKFVKSAALFHLNGSIVLSGSVTAPAHFVKQFHAAYADQADLDQMVADANLEDWTQLFGDKNDPNRTVERPTHEPWVNQNLWRDEVTTLARNAYFWEVDTEGNQLPYIDELQFREFQSSEVALMRAINGEIDCQARHIGDFANFTALKENEAKGDYRVQVWPQTGTYITWFNMTAKDARLAELFGERDFRIAISLSVDRDAVNNMLWEGLGRKKNYGPPPDSPYYYEEFDTAYLDYDPDASNELLDGLGYTERDSEGYRLLKDGSGDRISFIWTGGGSEPGGFELMLIDYWTAIGLECIYKGVERALRNQMFEANEWQMGGGMMRRCLVPIGDLTFWVMPWDRPFAQTWIAWYTRPHLEIAEEPPADHWLRDLWELYENLQQSPGFDDQVSYFQAIQEIWLRELPMQGYVGNIPQLVVAKNGLMGLGRAPGAGPEGGGWPWDCCLTVYENIVDNATFYWDRPEEHTL